MSLAITFYSEHIKAKKITVKLLNTPYSKMVAILVFVCLFANKPLLPRLRENILLNFEFKNEATRANLQVNKRILKWRPFWNEVYIHTFRDILSGTQLNQ